MALTSGQQALLDAASQVLEADREIEAAWLAGSLGRGVGDAFSDVDLLVLVRDSNATDVGLRYAQRIETIAKAVLVNPLFSGRVVNVVTEDWQRFDLSFIEPVELERFNADVLSALFNKGGRTPPAVASVPYRPRPDAVLRIVHEFLRVLGLLVVAVGRREWVLAISGLEILRGLTVDLMLEENCVSPAERGGALRRRPLLTDEQWRALVSLHPVAAKQESVLAANVELAAVFLPRARRLADRIGLAWPLRFETATKRHLRNRLGLIID